MRIRAYCIFGVSVCFTRACCADKLEHTAADDHAVLPVLESPLFDPLSSIAIHIKELQEKLPQLSEFVNENSSAAVQFRYVSTLIQWLSSHMKHVMTLLSDPPLGTHRADLTGIFTVMRRKLEQVITGIHVLKNVEAGPRLGECADQLRMSAEKALQAVVPLRTVLLESGKATNRKNATAILPSKALYQILAQIEGTDTQHRMASLSFMETVNSQLQEARNEVEEKVRTAMDFLKSLKHCVAADTVGWERAAALRTFMATKDLHKVPDPHAVENSAAITTTTLEKLSPKLVREQAIPNAKMSWPAAVTNLQLLHTAIVPELIGVMKRIQASEKRLADLTMKLRGASFLHHAVGQQQIPMKEDTKSTDFLEDKNDDDTIFAVIGGIPFFDL